MSRIRRLLGTLAWLAAGWWIVEWIRDRRRDRATRYPNDYGIRLRPLSPAETAAAVELEQQIARGWLDAADAAAVSSGVPSGRSTAAAGASP